MAHYTGLHFKVPCTMFWMLEPAQVRALFDLQKCVLTNGPKGIWATDFAAEHPQTHVIGTDL
jgi:hypothetical protein